MSECDNAKKMQLAAEKAKKVKSHARRHKNKDRPWEILPLGLMPDVQETDYYFVAYSRRDYGMVYADMFCLQAEGINLWYDRGMEVGKDWRIVAERMINTHECKGVIVYVTENSISSEAVQGELSLAFYLGKNIISISKSATASAEDTYLQYVENSTVLRSVGFEKVLREKMNPNITQIAYRLHSHEKKRLISSIVPEDLFFYDFHNGYAVLTGVKYLGIKEAVVPMNVETEHGICIVLEVGDCAFANCSSLEKVVLPSSLAVIGNYAFFNCTRLAEVAGMDYVWSIGRSAFQNCLSLVTMTIPARVRSINAYTFAGCQSLTAVECNFALSNILEGAFSGCETLTSIVLNDSLLCIGDHAFSFCRALERIEINGDVKVIGDYAFAGCSALECVFLGGNVKEIGSQAFDCCCSLIEFKVASNNKSFIDVEGNLYSVNGKVLIRYAIGKRETFFALPSKVEVIGENAFRDSGALESIFICQSIKTIRKGAFQYCGSLSRVRYGGVIRQWKSVAKQPDWNYGSTFSIVQCVDGNVPV